MTLNWRHKTGLFLTLVAMGIGLFLELSAKQTAGIALLGIAFSWLIGSLPTRAFVATFAILLCALGLYVAAPVWSDWNSTRKSAAQYDLAIANLQSVVEMDIESGLVQPLPDRGVTIPDSVQRWIRPKAAQNAPSWTFHYGGNPCVPSESVRCFVRYSFPKNMSDAEIMKIFQASVLLPRPAFSLGLAVRTHVWQMVGGLALIASGLVAWSWMFRRTRTNIG